MITELGSLLSGLDRVRLVLVVIELVFEEGLCESENTRLGAFCSFDNRLDLDEQFDFVSESGPGTVNCVSFVQFTCCL